MESVTGLSMPHAAVWVIGCRRLGKIKTTKSLLLLRGMARRDSLGMRGHWEETFIGLEIKDLITPLK
jgi:hypothetical protein